MRLRIELDDDLVQNAMESCAKTTVKETIEEALRVVIPSRALDRLCLLRAKAWSSREAMIYGKD